MERVCQRRERAPGTHLPSIHARINCVTIAAACRFPEGVALITDSRATWKTPLFPHFEDRLQKILALDRKVGLAYAGDDIRVPEAIARLLRRRIARDRRRAEPERIVPVLPRIACSCYQEYVAVTGHRPQTSIILAGTTQSGRVLLYTFEAPDFIARIPASGSLPPVATISRTCGCPRRGMDGRRRRKLDNFLRNWLNTVSYGGQNQVKRGRP